MKQLRRVVFTTLQLFDLTVAMKFMLSLVLAAAVACWWMTGDPFDPNSIQNQRVLVTGASSGIGEQLAYEYSRLGARLVITARRESLLKTVVQKCLDQGAKQVDALPADMSKPEDRVRLISFVHAQLGGLDHLILNHASITVKYWDGSQEDMDILMQDMEVNFVSFVDLTSKALPMLTESKGHIGVVSALIGKMGFQGFTQYSATKFALQGFFSSLRQELEFKNTGVSVTLCVLGFVKTDMALNLASVHYKNPDLVVAQGASVEGTAAAILTGVTNRVDEVYYPFSVRLAMTLQFLFSGFVERYSASFMK